MNVLLIGGSGFIGTKLSSILQDKDINFLILDKKKSDIYVNNYIYCDVRDEHSFPVNTNSSVIINLAAEHADNVEPTSLYYDVNVKGAENVCNFAKLKGINQIIFISSVAIYGHSNTLCINENGIPKPYNDYGLSKLYAEKVYLKWYEEDPLNRNLTIIRPTAVFGENNRGKGENIKSLAYVDNLAAFINYSISNFSGFNVFNYVDFPNLTIKDLGFEVAECLNKKLYVVHIPESLALKFGTFCDIISKYIFKLPVSRIRITKLMSYSYFNSSAFASGFLPPFKFKDALKKTLEYEFKK